jgi:hypothetical protein
VSPVAEPERAVHDRSGSRARGLLMERRSWFPEPVDEEPGSVARPYTITRGRTRSSSHREIELETLVWVTSKAAFEPSGASIHWRAVAELCRQITSLAEVAARLGVPLGVARVLIGDMADAGLVSLRRPRHGTEGSEIALLERVLHGLRQL